MTKTLFDYNYHVLPGDVLLLKSPGLLALGSRIGQRALRPQRLLRTAKFTHVALVISQTHIADAMPKEGVRIRSWRSAAENYDLDKCVVARHPTLLSLAHDPARLLARVQYYYAQRYTLMSLSRRKVKHNRGVVCSQFVALVLHDLGLPHLMTTAMQALPSDIDCSTRGKKDWRQFSFSEYGWHPFATTPPVGDMYWKVLADSLPSLDELLRDDKPAGMPTQVTELSEPAEDLATIFSKDDNPVINQVTTAALDPVEVYRQLSEAIGEKLASSMRTVEAVIRVTAELDRQVLAMADALVTVQRQSQKEGFLDISKEFFEDVLENGSWCQISSRSLLEQWHSIYIDRVDATIKVLADADSLQRLARHRIQLGESIKVITQVVTEANNQTQTLQEQFAQLPAFFQPGCDASIEKLVSLMLQQGSLLLKSMDCLEDEAADAILARRDGYTTLVSNTLIPVLPKLGQEVGLQAVDQLDALLELDQHLLDWVSVTKPILLLVTNCLASVQAQIRSSV